MQCSGGGGEGVLIGCVPHPPHGMYYCRDVQKRCIVRARMYCEQGPILSEDVL